MCQGQEPLSFPLPAAAGVRAKSAFLVPPAGTSNFSSVFALYFSGTSSTWALLPSLLGSGGGPCKAEMDTRCEPTRAPGRFFPTTLSVYSPCSLVSPTDGGPGTSIPVSGTGAKVTLAFGSGLPLYVTLPDTGANPGPPQPTTAR